MLKSGIETVADPVVPVGATNAPSRDADAATAAASEPASHQHNRTITDGVMWSGALRWLSQILAWSATIVVARRLSAEDYGIAGSATVFLGWVSLMIDGGIGRALVMRRERDPATIREAHGASLLIGVAVAVLMLAAALPLANFFGEARIAPLVACLAVVPLMGGANAVPTAVLQQKLDYRRLATTDFLRATVQGVTVLSCALGGLRYWSLVAGIVAGQFAWYVSTRRYASVAPAWPTRAALRGTSGYARHLVLSAMAWYAYSSADFATVGRVVGLAALGYYQFAWNIAQLPGEKLANVLQGVVGPFFGAIGDDRAALRHYFLVLSELLLSVMWPILFGFALVSPLAVPLVFGAKWAAAVPVLQILVICAASSSLSLMSQHVLSATGHASDTLKLNLVAVLVLPLAFYGAARYSGILAVACVWLVAQPTLTGIPLLRMRPAIDLTIREFLFAMRAPIVSALLMTSVLLALRPFIAGLVPIVQLLLLCALGALVYVTAFLLLFGERVSAIRELWRDRP